MSRNQRINKYTEYVYSSNSGLNKSLFINGSIFKVQYEPQSLCALKDFGQTEITPEEYSKSLNHFAELVYFNFQMTTDTSNVKMDVHQSDYVLDLFRFRMEEHLLLITAAGDTIPCRLAHTDVSNRDASLITNTMLAFDRLPEWKAEINEDVKLVFINNPFGSNVIIPFGRSEFESIPDLKI